jgi:lysozyme
MTQTSRAATADFQAGRDRPTDQARAKFQHVIVIFPMTPLELAMANENMAMSPAGMAALRQREYAVLRYYNDVANNCTWGVGTLAHHGPCTAEELRRPVTAAAVDAVLAARVHEAERAVRRQVRNHQLTQGEFDALVSYTYNVGATGARETLQAANRGADNQVVTHMNNNVYVHPRDPNGRRLPAVRVPGLVNRRRDEAAPFQTPQGAR